MGSVPYGTLPIRATEGSIRMTPRHTAEPPNLSDREVHAYWLGRVQAILDLDREGELAKPIPGIFRQSFEGQVAYRLAILEETAP